LEQCAGAQPDGLLRSVRYQDRPGIAAQTAIGRQVVGDLLAQEAAAAWVAIPEASRIGMHRAPP
jgi:hypothetical protein